MTNVSWSDLQVLEMVVMQTARGCHKLQKGTVEENLRILLNVAKGDKCRKTLPGCSKAKLKEINDLPTEMSAKVKITQKRAPVSGGDW